MKNNNKEDLRIIKTKSSLCRALEILLTEKDIADISIADICAAAQVNRSTFYKHFTSKQDFVAYFVYDVTNGIADLFRTDAFNSNSDQFHIESAILEIQKYESTITNLMNSARSPSPTAVIYNTMADYFYESFQNIPFVFPGAHQDLRMWSQFYAGGIMAVVLSWLSRDDMDAKEKATSLSELLSTVLKRIRLAYASINEEEGANNVAIPPMQASQTEKCNERK